MAGKETRKVKISYLVPTQWTEKLVTAELPTNLPRTSQYPLSVFYLLAWPDEDWKYPRIMEFPSIRFKKLHDDKFGDYVRANITPEAVESTLHVSFASPMKMPYVSTTRDT